VTAGYDQAQLLYLQQLGIDVWVPRDAIDVNATDSSALDVQPALGQEQTNPAQAGVGSTPAHQAPNVQSDPAPASSQPQVVERAERSVSQEIASPHNTVPHTNSISAPAFPLANPVSESASPTVAPVSQEPVPEFTLHYWCYRSGLWVVTAESDLTPQHHGFVHNVAQALQGTKSKPKHVGMFVWPMLDAPNVDQGESVAKRYLSEHFEQLKAFVEPKHLLCFAGSEQWLTDLPSTGIDLTIEQTLSSVDNKRALWNTIKPLCSLF